MGMFYIYTNKNSNDIYNSISFSNPYKLYIDPDNIYDLDKIDVKCKTLTLENFWDGIICIELLPKQIVIHHRVFFGDKFALDWDQAQNWFFKNEYNRATNLILSECYPTLSDAIDGVKYYCDIVAKTKATQYLLMGYKNFSD